MSKKLLALLIAVSTCCAFGCSDDDSDSCKMGEKRCDGNISQTCINGSWNKGTTCTNGCDTAKGVCKGDDKKPEACKTAGEKRCSGKELQECKDGNWSTLKVCEVSCDETKKECGGGDGVCTATSTSKCTGACSADKKAGYFWSKDTLKTVDCPNSDCTATNGYVQCGELPKCTAESTERCNVACSADKSVGYYWNSKDKKVGERKCPNNDCTIEGTSVKCEGDKGNGERPSDVPATCVKGTSKGMCSAEDKQPYICGDKGEYYKGKCESGTCFACSNGWVGCGATEADVCKTPETAEKCQKGGTAYCQKHCLEDGSKGYYYKQGKVEEVVCAKNDCIINSNKHVVCKSEDNAGGGSGSGKTCDKATTNPVCNETGDKVTYCSSSNELKDKDCPQCHVEGGTFWCNGDQNLANCVEGGTSKCRGNCVSDTLGYIWNKDENKVKEYTCTAPKKCTDNGAGYLSCK